LHSTRSSHVVFFHSLSHLLYSEAPACCVSMSDFLIIISYLSIYYINYITCRNDVCPPPTLRVVYMCVCVCVRILVYILSLMLSLYLYLSNYQVQINVMMSNLTTTKIIIHKSIIIENDILYF
jgi:hypothetical protein